MPQIPAAALLALALALAAGCTSPAYQAAQASCRADWMERLPPKWDRKLVFRGGGGLSSFEACAATGGGAPCTGAANPYWDTDYVDLNAQVRDRAIRDCTVKACLAQTGDPACTS